MSVESVLRPRWQAFCRSIRADDCDAIYAFIVDHYSEPPRYYHTLTHIEACLNELDRVRGHAVDPLTLEAAIWFHDVIYEPRRNDNEERSAQVTIELLYNAGVSCATTQHIGELVLATKHTGDDVTSPDAMLLIDIDLAILGQTLPDFAAYERAIRLEYAHVAEPAFRAGRSAILRRFLERPAIYMTPLFQQRYEQTARSNLRQSIAQLT